MILALLACRPDPAPEDLEQLCGYLFAHLDDERDREMEDGLSNLDAWLIEKGIGQDGLEVDRLAEDSVVDLAGDKTHTAGDAVGAAVDDRITHPVLAIAEVLIVADQYEVFDGTYEEYSRTFLGDVDCFMSQDCDRLDAENDFIARYGGVITVESEMHSQSRWVDLDGELALIQRGWLSGETIVSIDWATVEEQYILTAALPRGDETLRMQTIWIKAVLGEDAAPESAALNVMVNSMSAQSQTIQDYLDE